MPGFEIDLRPAYPALAEDLAKIAIRSGGTTFTHLLRPGTDLPEDSVLVPPAQLAFWLVDNWWRLHCECVPADGPTATWRLAHDLSGIGGYAWPRLAIWGEGERIGLLSRSDPVGVVGPVRYLTDALVYVAESSFDSGVDAFLDLMSGDAGPRRDRAALRSQIEALAAERSDPDVIAWRRLEAQLGFDVDEAPEHLMLALDAIAREFGTAAVGEAAQAEQGPEAGAVLEAEIASARTYHAQCDLRRAALLVSGFERRPGDPPWRLGEAAAAAVRKALGLGQGSLSNASLGDILGVRPHALHTVSDVPQRKLAYGLRLDTGIERGEVVALSSRWSADRRFEFARALGDAIWSGGERLGPITRAKTERQKFQRAFAQSLLCPHADLLAYLGDDRSDGALSEAARTFRVSERLIRTVLVNKHDLDRSRLPVLFRRISDGERDVAFEEAVEAA